ncbi:MAG: chondroitinase-B domain-containing protein [Akkermansiaceae bacterium]
MKFITLHTCLSIAWFLGFLIPSNTHADVYQVSSTAELESVLGDLSAGDIVELTSGVYSDVDVDIDVAGTATSPVYIYALELGGAKFEGATRIHVKGSHITIAGLSFDGNGGNGEKEGIIRLEANSTYCRVSNCQFKDFNEGIDDTNWLFIEGYNHRIDHNSFEGKSTYNATVFIKPNPSSEGDPETARNHLMEKNYFGTRDEIGVNGYESVRVADSTKQHYNMSCIVQSNLFYQAIKSDTGSEMEVISNKSRGNLYRNNTYRDCDGQMTMRHGDDCTIDGNFFFGTGGSRESGVRIIGRNHVVKNNYFESIGGSGLRSALVVMTGDNDWPSDDISNGYEAADGATIYNNTFVNCHQPINIGENKSDGVIPSGVEFSNNIVQSASGDGNIFDIQYSTSEIEFKNNIVYHAAGSYGNSGLAGVTYGTDPQLTSDESLGFHLPSSSSIAVDHVDIAESRLSSDISGRLRLAPYDAGCSEVNSTSTSFAAPLERDEVGPSFYGGPASSFTPPSGSTFPLVIQQRYFRDFEIGVGFSQTLVAAGGTGSKTWVLSSGILPDGMTLSLGGVLAGSPTTAGTYQFTITASAGGQSDSIFYHTSVVGEPSTQGGVLNVITTSLTPGIINTAYFESLTAAGGVAPYTWTINSGNLPAGITVSSEGTLAGTPSALGNSSFIIEVRDSAGESDLQLLSLVIGEEPPPEPLVVAGSLIPNGAVNQALTHTFTATGGEPSYSWSLESGNLPTGLTISSQGVLQGIPTAAGSFSFTLVVSDSLSQADSATFDLVIDEEAVASPITGTSFYQESNYVSIEAENFQTMTEVGGKSWQIVTLSGASGANTDNAIQALTNSGSSTTAGAGTYVTYSLNIATAGSYYVYVLGSGSDSSSDSIFAGTVADASNAAQINITANTWKQSGSTVDLAEGMNTLYLWMREPGCIIDKILIQTSSSSPSGLGSDESLLLTEFQTWKKDYHDDHLVDANSDIDGDGLAELLEFALGGDPTTVDAEIIKPVINKEGENLQFEFPRNSSLSSIRYIVEASDDLVIWPETLYDSEVDTLPNSADGMLMVLIQDAAKTRRFVRLRVEVLEP